jgi:PST family polysaccharide transporter
MFLAASPLPYRLGMDRTHVGHLLRFGLPLAGTSIIFFAIGYADQLTAGAILGSTALGFYALAFNLANWPVSMASQPLRRVAPAALSALQHDTAKMNAAMVSIVTVLASAALPLVFFLAGCAVPAVGFVYGSAWLPAAAALSWLVVAATAKVFCDLFYDYLVVRGKTGTVLIIQAGGLLVLLPALIVGTSWYGIAGLGAAQAAVTAALVFPLYIGQLRKCGLQTKDRLAGVWSPLAAGSVVGLIAWAAATLIPNHFLALTASGSCAVVVSAYLLFQRRGQLQLLRSIGRPAPEVISA